jgi:putative transposase
MAVGRRAKVGQLGFEFRTRGGRRKGAGRKPKGDKPGLAHRRRPVFRRRTPVHITLRVLKGVWNLRSRRCFAPLHRAFFAANERHGVRLTSFSVQGNHLHLLVEADDERSLGCAMRALQVRMARGLNRVMGRTGSVFDDRYHSHLLTNPTVARNAIHYVRDNARKHAAERGEIYSPGYVDPYSSAAQPRVVAAPMTWLLRIGWQRA